MGRRQKKFTHQQIAERERIEGELSIIKPIEIDALRLGSADGFLDYFLSMRDLYSRRIDAYLELEKHHKRVYGFNRYAEYDSFRSCVKKLYKVL